MENQYSLKISRAMNGYVVCFDNGDMVVEEVFEDEEEEFGELYSMEKVLWRVLNYFGVFGSKHDKKRIRIHIEEQK